MRKIIFSQEEEKNRKKHISQGGFTLIELAFVLVIIGLLIGLGASMFPMLVKQNKLRETRALVEESKIALIGYAMAENRLPYASRNEDGLEDTGVLSGYFPYRTVGTRGKDTYLKTLYYAVDPYLCTTNNLTDFTSHLESLINGTHTPDLYYNGGIAAAFVILSSGENLVADPPNDDNGNGRVDTSDNNQFASPGTPITQTYDDILEAISDSYLYGKLKQSSTTTKTPVPTPQPIEKVEKSKIIMEKTL
ncbi:MAG: prepilin-type N-terminal cleavage/methylation domain-containing protein [Deltaproteobacteria bacterium]|nr:prepilin-type N-terminal cleavage/methylation domain-containing protein [Deltaproteobacteria bacterium]